MSGRYVIPDPPPTRPKPPGQPGPPKGRKPIRDTAEDRALVAKSKTRIRKLKYAAKQERRAEQEKERQARAIHRDALAEEKIANTLVGEAGRGWEAAQERLALLASAHPAFTCGGCRATEYPALLPPEWCERASAAHLCAVCLLWIDVTGEVERMELDGGLMWAGGRPLGARRDRWVVR